MKKTFTDLSTFDWIYSKQYPVRSTRHKATTEIDRIHNDPKKINQLVSHLVIKKQ